MKLPDLERHLRQHHCVFHREGGAHTIWLNPVSRKIASVPRHREPGGFLDGEHLLPGFRYPLADLFKGWD